MRRISLQYLWTYFIYIFALIQLNCSIPLNEPDVYDRTILMPGVTPSVVSKIKGEFFLIDKRVKI